MMNKNEEQKLIDELNCFNLVKDLADYKEFSDEVKHEPNQVPDFIVNDKIGIEHFLINEFQDKKNASIQRRQKRQIKTKVDYYKENQGQLDLDIENEVANKFIEDIFNEQVRKMSEFNYSKFIKNFKRVYESHLDSMPLYRAKCERIGFLIEIPFLSPMGKHGYIITRKGKKYNQLIKSMPLTSDMIECLKLPNNADFIVFCMKPLNFSGKKKEYKKIKVLYIDTKNIENCIRASNVVICDEFDFSLKFKNKEVLKLHTKKEEDAENEQNDC